MRPLHVSDIALSKSIFVLLVVGLLLIFLFYFLWELFTDVHTGSTYTPNLERRGR